jgi:hypothetical protein
MEDKICVVFLCNLPYYHKFRATCHSLRTIGCYKGDITLIVGDDLYDSENNGFLINDELIVQHNIKIKHFPEYKFPESFIEKQRSLPRDKYWFDKLFQYHKFHIFDIYFKQWDYIFYMDCGMHIFSDVNPIIHERQRYSLVANRDGLDGETATFCIPETPGKGLKIGDQFIKSESKYADLQLHYNAKSPYFQTTMMIYDTSIINENTMSDLYRLLFYYPISITNDQGIIALYFTQDKPCWKQLTRKKNGYYYYDYVRCVNDKYIMIKSMDPSFMKVGYLFTEE